MKRHMLFAAMLACLTARPVLGQDPNNIPPDPLVNFTLHVHVRNELAALRAQVRELGQQLKEHQQQVSQQATLGASQSEELRLLSSRVGSIEAQLEGLKSNVKALSNSTNSLWGTVIRLEQDTSSILSKVQTDLSSRHEMQRVVQGKILFNNQTGEEQVVLINGNRWRVPPGISHLMVPCGVVYAQLPWESTKTWDNWQAIGSEQQMMINISY